MRSFDQVAIVASLPPAQPPCSRRRHPAPPGATHASPTAAKDAGAASPPAASTGAAAAHCAAAATSAAAPPRVLSQRPTALSLRTSWRSPCQWRGPRARWADRHVRTLGRTLLAEPPPPSQVATAVAVHSPRWGPGLARATLRADVRAAAGNTAKLGVSGRAREWPRAWAGRIPGRAEADMSKLRVWQFRRPEC